MNSPKRVLRRAPVRIVALCLVLAVLVPGGVFAAESAPTLTVAPRNDASRAVRWTGVAEASPGSQSEALFDGVSSRAGAAPRLLAVKLGGARKAKLLLRVWATRPDDLTVEVVDQSNRLIARSDLPGLAEETLAFPVNTNTTYAVRVLSNTGAATISGYQAAAWLRSVEGTNTGPPGRHLRYDKPSACGDIPKRDGKNKPIPLPPCYFQAKVPINIVFVGFDRAEIDRRAADIQSALPSTDERAPKIKPIVVNESVIGGAQLLAREGGADAREALLFQGSAIAHLPYAYQLDYRIHVADERYSRSLFAAAKAATTPGEFANPSDRAYLEAYNARATGLRRMHPVLPAAPVDFIDATKLEDWIARNPPKGIVLDPRKPANGYTYFVFDTYRPRYASEYFNLSRYHHFRVMNAATTDPDSGRQQGFDWGRIWGGRYRFIMQDVGAAPNSFEGSTQQSAVAYRTAFDGDSAATDPPVWEYTGCENPVDCGDLQQIFFKRLSENVHSALFLRFLASYGSRPRAADRYLAAATTLIDANAAPGAKPLDYAQKVIGARLRSLLPAAKIESSQRVQRLVATDQEQKALDEGRAQGGGAVSSDPIMRLADERRSRYAPEPPGTIAVPILNVTHAPGNTWAGADADGSLLAKFGGQPWGLLSGANAIDDAVGRSGATMPTLRRIGAALGLLPATGGVFFTDQLPPDLATPVPHPVNPQEQERAYYYAFDFTLATTATPMTTGFTYSSFEVLDRDAIMRAHTIDWLDRGLEDIADAFTALDARGYRKIPVNVERQIAVAGKAIGDAVGAMLGGYAQAAVSSARRVKRESEKTVALSLRAPRAPRR